MKPSLYRILAFTFAAGLSACAPSTAMDGQLVDNGAGGTGGTGGTNCTSTVQAAANINVDINSLTTCCEAHPEASAHCVPTSFVPEAFKSVLAACPDGASSCVPDKFIESGGSLDLVQCKSVGESEGRCLSICVPQVEQNAALLPQDVCDTGEKCIPCVNPLDGTSTGVCDSASELPADCIDTPADNGGGGGGGGGTRSCGSPGAPLVQASSLPACGTGAHCLDKSLLPADQVGQLAACPGTNSVCVPDSFIEANGFFTATSCVSLLEAEGRCLNTVIPQVAAQADRLPQGDCTTGEKCVTCFDPLTGADTGACRLSCDTGPTQPAKTAQNCCDGRAKCIPNSSIPDDQEKNLDGDECEDITGTAGNLCVPNELLNNVIPQQCTASGLAGGPGVCLSDCLNFGFQGLFIKQANCTQGFKCAPCNALGKPTGAPGCPP